MIKRLDRTNINTKEYLDTLYAQPDYLGSGYNGARERLRLIVNGLGKFEYHLDVGCANGEFTKYYLAKYPDTKGYGMDISTEALKLARENCPKGNFTTSLPQGMDLIHCGEVLEHIEKPQEFIDNLYDALKPGGMLLLTTPDNSASDCGEHIWMWDAEGVRPFFSRFSKLFIISNFNGNLLLVIACK